MGISNTLLASALFCAIAPAAALRFRPPHNLRNLVAALVVGVGAGVAVHHTVGRWQPFHLFEVIHWAYLLVVVTLPALFGIWFVSSIVRNERSRSMSLVGGIALVLAFAGVWGTHIEPNLLEIDRISVASPHVHEPIRVGVFSDLQTPNVGGIEREAIEALIAEAPDLIVVPGDLFQGPYDVVENNASDFAGLLAELVATTEVVAVVSGDSDTTGQLAPIVEASGALYLDNSITQVEVAGQTIRLAGVAVHSSQPKRDTIAALGDQTDAYTLLVSHRPGVTYGLPPNSDIDLIVAGHTHGAQINLPIISNYIWYSDVPPSVANGGLSRLNDFLLYVSTGVGLERHASPQVRFGVRPSIAIITVVPQASTVP